VTISSDERARLRGLVAGATGGPWFVDDEEVVTGPLTEFGHRGLVARCTESMGADAAFIAASRTAVPALLDALEEAERNNGYYATLEVAIIEAKRQRDEMSGKARKAEADLAAARAEVARWRGLASKAADGLDEWSESESCHRSGEAIAIQEALAEDRDDLRGLAEREAGR
jgi:hypothetical protein